MGHSPTCRGTVARRWPDSDHEHCQLSVSILAAAGIVVEEQCATNSVKGAFRRSFVSSRPAAVIVVEELCVMRPSAAATVPITGTVM